MWGPSTLCNELWCSVYSVSPASLYFRLNMSTMSTKTPQMSDEEEEEGSTSGDIDEKQFLNKSLTSMDWLQRLNAKYVSLQQQGTISTTFAENQINFPTNTHVVDGYTNNEDISKPNYR